MGGRGPPQAGGRPQRALDTGRIRAVVQELESGPNPAPRSTQSPVPDHRSPGPNMRKQEGN